jgi:hypothetical protein
MIESFSQPFFAEWFQQIIDRVYVEGTQRVFVIGGYEDHIDLMSNEIQYLEAIETGHLNIEKNQIGFLLRDGLHGFEAVRALGNNFDIGVLLQILTEERAREFFIVDDHDTHGNLRVTVKRLRPH